MLYKYLGPDRVGILFNLNIRFSQSSALNDPFESAYLIDMQTHKHEFLRTNEADLFKFMQENGWDTSDSEIKQTMQEALQDIKRHAEEIMAPASVGKDLAEFFSRALGVLSLSRVHDNLLMWAHYANSHKGFVLGLDDAHPFFHEEDGRGNKSHPRNVVYTSVRALSEPSDPNFYEKFLCQKSIEWAYEEEVRIFRAFGRSKAEFASHPPDKVHLFALPPECIKRVFIGANASPELRQKILHFIRKRRLKVEIYDSFISAERYELRFEKITPERVSYAVVENYHSAGKDMNEHQVRDPNAALINHINRMLQPLSRPADADDLDLCESLAMGTKD